MHPNWRCNVTRSPCPYSITVNPHRTASHAHWRRTCDWKQLKIAFCFRLVLIKCRLWLRNSWCQGQWSQQHLLLCSRVVVYTIIKACVWVVLMWWSYDIDLGNQGGIHSDPEEQIKRWIIQLRHCFQMTPVLFIHITPQQLHLQIRAGSAVDQKCTTFKGQFCKSSGYQV